MNNKKMTISQVVAEHLCHSCGACCAACSKDAIQHKETAAGYVLPVINRSVCIDCGLCYEVCPGVHFGKTLQERMPPDPFVGKILSCHVGRATDNNISLNSQSGGVATALLKHLFDTGQIEVAIVAVMREGTPPRGEVLIAKNAEELLLAQKSKYTPIPMLKALRKIGSIKGDIALVGLPCHIHGLQNLLDSIPVFSKYKFFRIGLICDRVMTTAAIDFLGQKATSNPVNNLVFRDKISPSYPGNPVVTTTDCENIILKASLRMVIKDFFTPIRCRLCFDKLNVFADVVLGDPHGVAGVDRLNGETQILARTDNGQNLVHQASQTSSITIREVSIDEVIKGQRIENKRNNWSGYMKAWSDIGRTQPLYPIAFTSLSYTAEQMTWLVHALHIYQLPSKIAVMRAANKWLSKKKIYEIGVSLIKFGTKRFRRLIKKGKNDN